MLIVLARTSHAAAASFGGLAIGAALALIGGALAAVVARSLIGGWRAVAAGRVEIPS